MAKISKTEGTITLTAAETKKWENSGPVGEAFRANIRDIARGLARGQRKKVEILAALSAGGWTADAIDFQ